MPIVCAGPLVVFILELVRAKRLVQARVALRHFRQRVALADRDVEIRILRSFRQRLIEQREHIVVAPRLAIRIAVDAAQLFDNSRAGLLPQAG